MDLGNYEIVPGKQMGPLRLGMSRADVDALGILKTHPQYSGMTLPYTVYYEDDVLVSAELSLMHATETVKVGELSFDKTTSMQAAIKLLGDCQASEAQRGGTTTSCRSGGLKVAVGSGNPSEVWLRLYSDDGA